MTTRISVGAASDSAVAAVQRLDTGSSPGFLEIRTGAQPADPATTSGLGTLLVTITLQNPAYEFGAPSAGTVSLNGTPLSGVAVAGGDAGWFRMYQGDAASGDAGQFDGAVTDTSGNGELKLDTITINSGQTVALNSLPYTQPQSE